MLLDMYYYLTNLTRLNVFCILFAGYLIYYLIEVVKRPILAIRPGPFKEFLHKYVPILEQKFRPAFWCVESRAQTVIASIIRANILPNINYRREILTLNDGGEVALDWLESNCDENSPIIIILPGLTGESQAEYCKCLVYSANKIKIRCCVFNNRGLGGIALKTPRLYCAANCEDLSEVIHHVRKLNPNVRIGATGISMGGLILGNYIAENTDEAMKNISAAMIISVPWDVYKGSDSIEKKGLNSLLGRHLAGRLCSTVKKYDILFNEEFAWDMKQVLQSKTIKEFDSFFTSKHFGYEDVDGYYRAATLHNKLHKIKVPLLCLSAADDPFQPLDAIPMKAAEKSSHVAIVVTARGGHIGFLENNLYFTDQYMGRLFSQYFNASLAENHDEFVQVSQNLFEISNTE